MTMIRRLSDGVVFPLTASYSIGRSINCTMRLSSLLVSNEHAAIHWSGTAWELRDLGSANGTFLADRRLQPGERLPIARGAQIAFGDQDDLFELVDDSPPVAVARGDNGLCIRADEDGLFLPDGQNAELHVFEDEPGYWFVEEVLTGEQRRARDGEWLRRESGSWQLALPIAQQRTRRPSVTPVTRDTLCLHFDVSREGSHVVITAQRGEQTATLPCRAHSDLLLVLARARIRDAAIPDLSEIDRGWMTVSEIVDILRLRDERQVNVLVCRARAQCRRARISGLPMIIERRRDAPRLRLGVADVTISS